MLETLSSYVLVIIRDWGYLGIFILMTLESAGVLIPSEVVVPFAGFLAARHDLNFWWVVFYAALGNLAGSLILYFIAYRWGKTGAEFLSKFSIIHLSHVAEADKWFKKYGNISVFFGRLLPVVRTFISFPAGMFKVNLGFFSLLTFSGALIWSAFLAYLGFILGENWEILSTYFRKFDIFIVAIIIGFILWEIYHRSNHFKKKNKSESR